MGVSYERDTPVFGACAPYVRRVTEKDKHATLGAIRLVDYVLPKRSALQRMSPRAGERERYRSLPSGPQAGLQRFLAHKKGVS